MNKKNSYLFCIIMVIIIFVLVYVIYLIENAKDTSANSIGNTESNDDIIANLEENFYMSNTSSFVPNNEVFFDNSNESMTNLKKYLKSIYINFDENKFSYDVKSHENSYYTIDFTLYLYGFKTNVNYTVLVKENYIKYIEATNFKYKLNESFGKLKISENSLNDAKNKAKEAVFNKVKISGEELIDITQTVNRNYDITTGQAKLGVITNYTVKNAFDTLAKTDFYEYIIAL